MRTSDQVVRGVGGNVGGRVGGIPATVSGQMSEAWMVARKRAQLLNRRDGGDGLSRGQIHRVGGILGECCQAAHFGRISRHK